MTLNTGVESAWDVIPSELKELVSVVPKNSSHGTVANVTALRRVVNDNTIRMMASIGIEPIDIVFNLRTTTLGGYVPVLGDWITDVAGVSYTIQSIRLVTIATRYRAVCQKVVA